MAKRRRNRPGHRWLLTGLVVLVLAMGGYVGHHLYERHVQQQIIERQQNAKQLFIKEIAPEAQAMQAKYHVRASITMAQAILESDWGASRLAADYHNLFGIKGTGPDSRLLTTKEYVDGHWVQIRGRFKVYDSWAASIADHTGLMLHGTDTNQQNYQAVIAAPDYRQAAIALQRAGYATDPDYAAKLIGVIKTYHLDQYDQ